MLLPVLELTRVLTSPWNVRAQGTPNPQKIKIKIVGVQSRTECRPWNVRAQKRDPPPHTTHTPHHYTPHHTPHPPHQTAGVVGYGVGGVCVWVGWGVVWGWVVCGVGVGGCEWCVGVGCGGCGVGVGVGGGVGGGVWWGGVCDGVGCVWCGEGGLSFALEHSKVCTLCDFGHLQFKKVGKGSSYYLFSN
jgi:hypothetical protein